MNDWAYRVRNLARRQHGAAARWQLADLGWSRSQIEMGCRGLRRVFRGVCVTGDLTELGWYMAAALAMGPTGAISHLSGLMLMGLRPFQPVDIHVSHLGGTRETRNGLIPHRRSHMATWTWAGIPVTTPTQSLQDADLLPHEVYRALEAAEKLDLDIPLVNDVVRLKQAVTGFTRSDSEARLLWLLHQNGMPLPEVNQILNGYETDFHWPERRLVVEVDGWRHHREKPNFDSDRHRGLVHRAAGFEVIRISADHVHDRAPLILAALHEVL